jgi:hypothetical protein
MSNTPQRLPWIFPIYDPPLYFITFNTHHRQQLLANEQVHDAFIAFAREAERRGISVAGMSLCLITSTFFFVEVGITRWPSGFVY